MHKPIPIDSSFPNHKMFMTGTVSKSDSDTLKEYCSFYAEELASRLVESIYGSQNATVIKHWLSLNKKKFLKQEIIRS